MQEVLEKHSIPSIAHYLQWRAHHQPTQLACRFLLETDGEEVHITYQELDAQAREIALRLRNVCEEGERVLLLYPPGLSYMAALFGCLYAGVIAVPAYPPHSSASLPRLRILADNAQVRIMLTTSVLASRCQGIGGSAMQILCWPSTEGEPPRTEAQDYQLPARLTSDGLAYLQYTSGSTTEPRGVMITHQNLLYNLEQIQRRFELTEESRGVIWLPPYHDMGLIGGILQPLYTGFPITLLAPTTFIRQPLRWLQAISDGRATSSGGPAFAFDLCIRHISAQQRATLDLSSWNLAFCGAEPIPARTLEQFAATFAACGFRSEAFYPCYGLAEATVFVSGRRKAAAYKAIYVEKQALQERLLVPVASAKASSTVQALVSCGEATEEQKICIVHPETLTLCREQEIGEVWIAGPGVAQGYWGASVATEQTFQARILGSEKQGYLRTGDLGCVMQGELFIVGRLKDLILIRGRNYYPQDIEQTVGYAHPALRPGASAAFFTQNEGEEERLVVVQEIERRFQREEKQELFQAIRRALIEEHAILLHDIVLVKPGSLPRTSSGKIQRYLCRERFLQQQLSVVESEHLQTEQDTVVAPQPLRREDLSRAKPDESRRQLVQYLISCMSQLTGLSESIIDGESTAGTVGLDSLLMMELKVRLERDLQIMVPFSLLGHTITLKELANHLLDQLSNGPKSAVQWTLPQNGHYQPSLSYGQQALWFMHQFVNNYTVAKALEIQHELHIEAFHQALKALIRRHPILRTVFPIQGSIPVPVVRSADSDEQVPLDFVYEDSTDWDEEQMRARLESETYRPFDLAHGPLVRVRIFSQSPVKHILLIVMDHIICDLWSLIVLIDELSTLYQAACQQEPALLPAQTLYFEHYVQWQREMLTGPEGQTLSTYWQQALRGLNDPVEFPLDYPRPSQPAYRAASHHFQVSEKLVERLHQLVQEEGVTLYALLVSAFQALYYHYTRREDLVIGTMMNGRTHAELEQIVGYFVNPVALRIHLHEHLPFRALLQSTYAQILQALDHQDYPFPVLVEQLQPLRNSGYIPFFHTMFVWQHSHLHGEQQLSALGVNGVETEIHLKNLTFKTRPLAPRVTQFDLLLTMAEVSAKLEGELLYRSDLFRPETIALVANHFCTLLESIVCEPDRPISSYGLLTASERALLLSAWNKDQAEPPAVESIWQLFQRQVKATPDAIAIVAEEMHSSYAQLNELADRVGAALLLSCPTRIEELRVGIYMQRSIEFIIAIWGVLKAGGSYIPLDPTYPPERLAFIYQDAQPHILLTQHTHAVPDVFTSRPLIFIEDLIRQRQASPEAPDAICSPTVHPAQLLYTIYTSGSSGVPKGVAVTQQNVLYSTWTRLQYYQTVPVQRFLLLSSFAFDSSVAGLFWTLCAGGTLLLLEQEAPMDGGSLAHMIARQQVTHLLCVPSLYAHLLAAGSSPQLATQSVNAASPLNTAHKQRFATLQAVIVAGEALKKSLLDLHFQELPDSYLFDEYGPTEGTVWASVMQCTPDQWRSVIGRPIAHASIYLLDSQMQLVPVGIPGELYIAGPGVARGYWQRPDLTAERFLPDPFSQKPGMRLYRTGDMASYQPDGTLLFLGRNDLQIKIHGFRIELEEIETHLGHHPSIQEAVVTATEHGITAYVVWKDNLHPDEQNLRFFLQDRLPTYMQPASIHTVQSLPRTPNGKVDRLALQAVFRVEEARNERSALDLSGPTGVQQTEIQRQLASIWEEILGIEDIDIQENFFALGGHSLLATQMQTRIRECLHVEVPLRGLFERPTIAELEKLVQQLQEGQVRSVLPAIQSVSRELEPYALSFAQEQLWLLSQIEGETHYNEVGALAIQGKLDVPGLEQAINALVHRHTVLRTVFEQIDGTAYQIIMPHQQIALPVYAVECSEQSERQQIIQRMASQQRREILNLQQGPLFQVLLLKFADEDYVLICTLHHIIVDHWSIAIFLQDLSAAYQMVAQGFPPQLPALPLQYADFALWQRQRLQGALEQQLIKYWQQQLAHAPLEKPLFSDLPRGTVQTYQGAELVQPLPNAVQQAIKRLSQELSTTPFVVLLTAYALLLSQYSGQNNLVIGTDIAGRIHQDLESLIGFFVNILPLHLVVSNRDSVETLIGAVHEVVIDALQHQELPLSRIVDALGVRRHANMQPLCQVLFVYQNTPHTTISFPGVQVQMLQTLREAVRFDLVVFVEEREGGLITTWNYNQDLFTAATITALLQSYQQILHQVVTASHQSVQTCLQAVQMERMRQVMKPKERRASSFASFRAQKPDPSQSGAPHSPSGEPQGELEANAEQGIACTDLVPGKPFPRLVQPGASKNSETSQLAREREFLLQELEHSGALLFRGFALATTDDFEAFARMLCGKLINEYGDLPHDRYTDFIYTSTPYPAHLPILWHNEASHTSRWPQYILFYCRQPALEGGETTLLDGRNMYQHLRPELRERFQQKKLQYVRNFVEGIDVPWQDFFHTQSREEVEERSRREQVICEWYGDGSLKTSRVCEAIKTNLRTGEKSWFNQLLLHHLACLEPATREALLSLFPADRLPRQVYYGDGTAIEDEIVHELLQLFEEHSVNLKLRVGDVLLLDNTLMAHGRAPFVGERKIMVAMGNLIADSASQEA